jgi:alpha-tubulin suppressor-like RCC1 family protein
MPELVRFPYQTSAITFPRAKAAKSALYQLSMSKFHTVVATSEAGQSAKVWGFGTGGRLGLDRKMQASPASIMGISGTVVTTALGRDHTVLVTSRGEVYTLGNNKFGQLGYASEAPASGQDPIQYSPKRVVLNVAKLFVKGAAASKWHTVIHTETELYTFGFNYGQLGYERKGDIQLGPRKVASIPPGLIMQVAASDNATACLMSSNDVVVFYKYAYHKVSFSLFPYPDGFSELNYPRVVNENRPRKIACSENKFGMMTGWGDIHVWSYSELDSSITLGSLPSNHTIPFSPVAMADKPRRVWTYGGDRTQAIDFALGQNGSVILLTKGGHVYIGTNKGTSLGRNVKWQR